MVRGVIVKIDGGKGPSTREVTGIVKREDTGEVIPFKSSLSRVPGLEVGDWISGRVRSGEHYMSTISFAQRRLRSGVPQKPRTQ